jgi:hypothetical protein
MQHWRKQNTDKGLGSKAEKLKIQGDSNNYVMYCYVCRKTGPDIAGKTEFVNGKKFKCEKSCLSK